MYESSLRRKITVTLDEKDWRKFLQANPNPVDWIVQKIKDSIKEPAKPAEHDCVSC